MEHMSEYGLSYGTQEEYQFRMAIFAANDAEYKKINSNPENTFVVGHNQFSTWTEDEYKRILGFKMEEEPNLKQVVLEEPSNDFVDWR